MMWEVLIRSAVPNLLYLAPDIQLRVLDMEAVDAVESTNEKAMRGIAVTTRVGDATAGAGVVGGSGKARGVLRA
jgi:hypothetical protein